MILKKPVQTGFFYAFSGQVTVQ